MTLRFALLGAGRIGKVHARAVGSNPQAKLVAWGPFKQNLINVAKAGELQSAAVKLMDRAGYK